MVAFLLPPPPPLKHGLRYRASSEKRPRTRHKVVSKFEISSQAVQFVQYLGAGGICALFSHTAATPLDVVKTRIQSNNNNNSDDNPGILAILATAKMILKEDGMRGLLAGANATAIGYFLHGALKYAVYETTAQGLGAIMAALSAETVACVVLCPLEYMRIRSVTSKVVDARIAGGALELYELYAGFLPLFFRQAPYTVTQFLAYESAIPLVKSRFIAGFMAGIAAATVSQPADTILTRINSNSSKNNNNNNSDNYNYNYDFEEWLRLENLYTAFLPRLLHVTFIVGIQFAIYDSIKRQCGLL